MCLQCSFWFLYLTVSAECYGYEKRQLFRALKFFLKILSSLLIPSKPSSRCCFSRLTHIQCTFLSLVMAAEIPHGVLLSVRQGQRTGSDSPAVGVTHPHPLRSWRFLPWDLLAQLIQSNVVSCGRKATQGLKFNVSTIGYSEERYLPTFSYISRRLWLSGIFKFKQAFNTLSLVYTLWKGLNVI